jgi:hypothetical protein
MPTHLWHANSLRKMFHLEALHSFMPCQLRDLSKTQHTHTHTHTHTSVRPTVQPTKQQTTVRPNSAHTSTHAHVRPSNSPNKPNNKQQSNQTQHTQARTHTFVRPRVQPNSAHTCTHTNAHTHTLQQQRNPNLFTCTLEIRSRSARLCELPGTQEKQKEPMKNSQNAPSTNQTNKRPINKKQLTNKRAKD